MHIEILRDTYGLDIFDIVGYIPDFLHENDPRPAREQFNTHYSHGGGWDPFPGFTLNDKQWLKYPGDPPLKPWARMTLRDETILIYECGWTLVLQKDGTWEVARLD